MNSNKEKEKTREGEIYTSLYRELSQQAIQQEILSQFPKKSIHRRNTGYAVDELLHFELFGGNHKKINVAKLLSGSEGTLVFSTAIRLQLDDIQPKEPVIVASHFKSIDESLRATVLAMNHNLYACELMDSVILDCTNKDSIPLHLQRCLKSKKTPFSLTHQELKNSA